MNTKLLPKLSGEKLALPALLLLILASLVTCWHFYGRVSPSPHEPPKRPTQAEIATVMLNRARQADRERISVTAPALWAKVENAKPIANANSWFAQGSTCVTKEGEEITLVDIEDGRLLVRYDTNYREGGTACPDGTLFYISTNAEATLAN